MATQNNSYAHYTASRDLLLRVKKTFTRTMFVNFALMLIIAACAVPAVAAIPHLIEQPESLSLDNYTEGDKFLIDYSTLSLASAAVMAVIFFSTIVGAVLAVLSAGQIKLATIGLLALDAGTLAVLLFAVMPYKVLFGALYVALLGLNIRCLLCYRDLAYLKALPGYPHFSERLSQSEQPREELDLSNLHDAAPMDEVAVNPDAALESAPPTPGMELYGAVHARVSLEKGKRVQLSKDALRPAQENPFDIIKRAEAPTLDAVAAPALAEMEPFPATKPAPRVENLPSLDEIRRRYAQDNLKSTGDAH